jgi:hypothetical protein
MNTKTFSYKAAFEFTDAVMRNCLPQWFPSLGMILCAATMAASFVFRLSTGPRIEG